MHQDKGHIPQVHPFSESKAPYYALLPKSETCLSDFFRTSACPIKFGLFKEDLKTSRIVRGR